MGHPDETPGDGKAEAKNDTDSAPVQENAGSPAPEQTDTSAETPENTETADADAAEAPAKSEPELEVIELSETDRLKAEVAELRARLREVSKAYKDRDAEMEEFRQRQKNVANVQAERKVFTVVSTFFDPIMNLKRSVEAGGDDAASVLAGLKIVHEQFQTALTQLGLTEVPGEGAVFDPDAHEALAVMPVQDPEQDGKVVVVHTNGYQLRGKTLKAAQVVVGKYTEPAEA